jgi:crotonobetainyl-CoA:carnitine CoA-transferase CaiB-like acyl-CoA transferase
MVLADQGADVIKIEPPGIGDFVRFAWTSRGGMSALFANLNRNKRSVVLDLKKEQGKQVLCTLAAGADVLVQNSRPGAMDRMGLGYDDVTQINPNLVYVSVSGFGETGPDANKPVYDTMIQGVTGMIAAQVNPRSGARDLIRSIVCDKATGLIAAQAITAALFARERGSGGQHLRLSMLDAGLAFFWPDGMMNHTLLGEGITVAKTLAEMYSLTPTRDGHIIIAPLQDKEFQGIARALGRLEWLEDPRLKTVGDRTVNFELMEARLEKAFTSWETASIVARLEAEGVPVGRINRLDQVASDPQVIENAILMGSEHPHAGPMIGPRHPVHFQKTPVEMRCHAPMLGEHTKEVLLEAGYTQEQVAALGKQGVLG